MFTDSQFPVQGLARRHVYSWVVCRVGGLAMKCEQTQAWLSLMKLTFWQEDQLIIIKRPK